ncbi:hypothetical protein K8B33_03300 [Alcanivorax sp. JB21]|uniref:hypothetical protein n=1 Tax=Alcanivorax limicola TaxID=2874102 RepID=UPI001CBBBB24|nr:hypothetical protein [Alcanivorax limicola]MBZ2188107.1 hypothetical protein [Alcanivorax limicola]
MSGWPNRSRFLLAGSLWLCLSAAATAQSVPGDIIDRGWRPPVSLAGEGDPHAAVERMREYAELRHTLVHNTEYHEATQAFVGDLRSSLERFDLKGFYRLLPETAGEDRQLNLEGVLKDGTYRVGPGTADARQPRPSAAVLPMGDMQASIRAREINAGRATHYLLSGDVRVGMGGMSWPAVVEASRDTLRLTVEGEPAFQGYRGRVLSMNPKLARHEVDVLAPLWAAYPAIWELVADLGEIESLVLAGSPADQDRELKVSVRVNTDSMSQHYPSLARYLNRLGSLITVSAAVHDEYGEVLGVEMNTRDLRAEITMLIRDGQPVATRHGKAVPDAVPLLDHTERRLSVHVDTRVELLGIVADVTGLQGYLHYKPAPGGAVIGAQMIHVPAVKTSGRALGIMPAGAINFVLPRSIDQLARDFLTVATQGNNGRGITGTVVFEQSAETGEAELHASGAFEALDNFMVRLGMRMVSDRLIPDTRTAEEIGSLVSAVQAAFVDDLDLFERRVAGL